VRTDRPEHPDLSGSGINFHLNERAPDYLDLHLFDLRVAFAHANDELAAHLARDLPQGCPRRWIALTDDLFVEGDQADGLAFSNRCCGRLAVAPWGGDLRQCRSGGAQTFAYPLIMRARPVQSLSI
jgi:hypothetical protein